MEGAFICEGTKKATKPVEGSWLKNFFKISQGLRTTLKRALLVIIRS